MVTKPFKNLNYKRTLQRTHFLFAHQITIQVLNGGWVARILFLFCQSRKWRYAASKDFWRSGSSPQNLRRSKHTLGLTNIVKQITVIDKVPALVDRQTPKCLNWSQKANHSARKHRWPVAPVSQPQVHHMHTAYLKQLWMPPLHQDQRASDTARSRMKPRWWYWTIPLPPTKKIQIKNAYKLKSRYMV